MPFTLTPHVTQREYQRRAALIRVNAYLARGYLADLEAAIAQAREIGVDAPDGIGAVELRWRLERAAKEYMP